MSPKLWQTLLKLNPANHQELTCDECFALLEYLIEIAAADVAPQNAAGVNRLQQIAETHVAACPDCRQHHLERLHELEAHLSSSYPLPPSTP